ncbi:MAG TPA: sigma 54-interacting transcriptional regulator [Polyangia bacterium]|nr:sigma 54-interacting transcriptional regulator [Polyangia bacterium]
MQTKLAAAEVLNGRWRLDRPLGAGADATLFAATDLRDGRAVALKILHASLFAGDDSARARLRWEFAVLAAIEHPHLVRVFDLDSVEGRPFFTCELCDSPPPTRLTALPPPERARVLCQLLAEVGSALEALHRRGLVHRDIKPSNLLADGSGATRLGDLGLSSLRGAAGGARGTLGFLAPEALFGAADARADLWSLGATAHALWSGVPPFAAARIDEHVRALDKGRPARLAGAPAGLQALVDRLLARDPAARPSTARAVVDEALRLGARLDGAVVHESAAPPLCNPALAGREAELATLVAALGRARVVLVEGAPGAGKSRLIDEARRARQLDDAAAGRTSLAWRNFADDRPLTVVAALAEAPAVLHVAAVAEPRAEELLGLAAAGAAAPSTVIAEVEEGAVPALAGDGVVRIRLAPLDDAAVARLCASMLFDGSDGAGFAELARAVARASGGNPRLAVEIVRAVAARTGPPSAADVGALDGQNLAGLVAAALDRLPATAHALAEALAVLGRDATVAELAALLGAEPAASWAAALAARAAGVADVDDATGCLRFPSAAHADAAYAALSPRRRLALHRRALAQAAADAPVDRARHLIALAAPEAADAALVAGERLVERGRVRAAVAMLEDAERLGAGAVRLRAALRLGTARTLAGDYVGALAALAPAEAARGEPALRVDAAIAAARALQRAGDLPAAEARLVPLVASAPGAVGSAASPRSGIPARARDEARGLLGRVLVDRGDYARAAEVCAASEEPSAAVAEARGLACLYLGRFDDADHAFAAVERAAAAQPAQLARARNLRGMVAHSRDALADAAELYGSALTLARHADDLHGAAIYAMNLGAILREAAEYERALGPSADAARDLGRLGKRVERAFALFNYGNLLLSIGDLEGADRAAAEAEALARATDAARELGYARMLAGDLARRRGDLTRALDAYHAAVASLQGAAAGDRLAAALNLAEALAESGDADAAARAALAEAHALAEAANQVDAWLPVAVRAGLALGDPVDPARLTALGQLRDRAARSARRDVAFRADLALARAHIRRGQTRRALASLSRADQIWKEIRMRTPELRRDAIDDDPDARRLRELLSAGESATDRKGPSAPTAASAPSPQPLAQPEPLRKLLSINKRLNSEQRLPVLLDLILDTVLDLTSAERGFILLTDGAGAWRVEAARNIAEADLDKPAAAGAFSRSIAERAAREGVPIVTLDATGDERFEAALSVSDLKLRSVLAVPLAVKGRTVGCVYADHRLRAGAFGDAEVALVCDLAEQAAIAVENARLLADFARAQKSIDALNRSLQQEVAKQAVELGELHKEVRTSRAALSVRYNYDNLVGRTPRMLELFRLLDRVTDTALPVVIYGESGTGKELVARAIHHNGPRRGKAFVSESCAAIPETLLEAALFGHVRGAFTGADAERRGLFEVADGGTLFLDEVGEMPPSMQVKLLRVLQEGELRRVGAERTIKVDVRVLVASNRDLGRLVEEGKFREDLFYRLNVVRVALPPLRERRDDIPLLVEHFLRKFADENKRPLRRIARAALHKLVGYRWPGNVRELENEIARAASLGGDIIAVEDLSPQVAAGEPEAAVESPDDLTLKHRVERLERTLLREALHRSAGNQTQAARLLGLSRFGLQKKLRRYEID